MAIGYDPVAEGIISNLRRPGGNVTGITLSAPALVSKQLELLHELLPKAKRFLVLTDSFTRGILEESRNAAKELGVEIIPAEFAAPPYPIAEALERGRKAGADALILLTSPVLIDQRAAVYELALKHRLPVVVSHSGYWDGTGWLLGYGAILEKTIMRAGDIAASILRGKKAGEIPVEQPTEFELAINLKTAKLLGLKVPQSLLLRADKVVE